MKKKRLWKCKSMYHPKRKTSVCRIQSRVAREERQESETSEFRQNDRDTRGGGGGGVEKNAYWANSKLDACRKF